VHLKILWTYLAKVTAHHSSCITVMLQAEDEYVFKDEGPLADL